MRLGNFLRWLASALLLIVLPAVTVAMDKAIAKGHGRKDYAMFAKQTDR